MADPSDHLARLDEAIRQLAKQREAGRRVQERLAELRRLLREQSKAAQGRS